MPYAHIGLACHPLARVGCRPPETSTDRIDHLYQDPHETGRKFILHHGDLMDSSSLIRIIQQVWPNEIYNLAAQSHVAVSLEEPEYTANSDALGALRWKLFYILSLLFRSRCSMPGPWTKSSINADSSKVPHPPSHLPGRNPRFRAQVGHRGKRSRHAPRTAPTASV